MKILGLIIVALFVNMNMLAQCSQLNNHPQGADHAKRLFVYRDAIKAKNFENELAINQWRELYKYCHAGNGNILADGEKIYKYFAAKAEKGKDKETMKIYLDSVAIVLNQRIECYSHKIRKKTGLAYAGYRCYLLGRHYIVSASKFNPEEDEEIIIEYYKKAKTFFKKSIDLDGQKAEVKAYEYFGFTSVEIFKATEKTEADIEEIRTISNFLQDILTQNAANATTEEEKAKFLELGKTIKSYYNPLGGRILGCDYFIKNTKPLFYKNYNDLNFIKKEVFWFLLKRGCSEEDEFLTVVKKRYIELHDSIIYVDDWTNYVEKGYRALVNGEDSIALEYFIKGIDDTSTEKHWRFDGAMRAGALFQRNKKWNEALECYNKAISLDSSSGKPYIKLGLLYLSANKNCNGFDRQLLAKVAIDFFARAKGFSDTAEEGAEKVRVYSEYLPSKELFPCNAKPGTEITAGCVLKKTTIIRTKD